MMYPKPKSAPGGVLRSKLVKNRTNAMKEIEAWAKKADEAGTSNASRMSGQLSDNVTEERMLRSKLWELSKERYKFLTQNAYEKKVFTDRMQRKSSALLRRTNSASGNGATSDSGASRAKRRWNDARLALTDKTDIEGVAKVKEPDDCKPDKEQSKRRGSVGLGRNCMTPAATPITIRPATTMGIGGRLALAPIPSSAVPVEDGLQAKPYPSPLRPSNPRNMNFNKSSPIEASGAMRQPSAAARGQSSPRPSPGTLSSPRPQQTRRTAEAGASSKPSSATSQRSTSWNNPTTSKIGGLVLEKKRCAMTGRYGQKLESKTKDPRYSSLEHSLSPIHKQRSSTDINSIVSSFDSLHIPPKKRKEAKPKIELKAMEYIDEQGYIF